MYSSQLCPKCLHMMEYHEELANVSDNTKVDRCTIGICGCIIIRKRNGDWK